MKAVMLVSTHIRDMPKSEHSHTSTCGGHRSTFHAVMFAFQAGDEGRKVAEVAFINALNEQDRKLALQEKQDEGGCRASSS